MQPILPLRGDYANNPAAQRFIDRMVSQHGFNRQQLHDLFAQTQRLDWVIRLMDRQAPTYTPPSGPNGAWLRYRKK
ncbi:murein transglycosylase B, partial [Xanthomonas citri pv. citri]|nr:murein transglycosylase B [Xanthomonas citri pv. citri]